MRVPKKVLPYALAALTTVPTLGHAARKNPQPLAPKPFVEACVTSALANAFGVVPHVTDGTLPGQGAQISVNTPEGEFARMRVITDGTMIQGTFGSTGPTGSYAQQTDWEQTPRGLRELSGKVTATGKDVGKHRAPTIKTVHAVEKYLEGCLYKQATNGPDMVPVTPGEQQPWHTLGTKPGLF